MRHVRLLMIVLACAFALAPAAHGLEFGVALADAQRLMDRDTTAALALAEELRADARDRGDAQDLVDATLLLAQARNEVGEADGTLDLAREALAAPPTH